MVVVSRSAGQGLSCRRPGVGSPGRIHSHRGGSMAPETPFAPGKAGLNAAIPQDLGDAVHGTDATWLLIPMTGLLWLHYDLVPFHFR